MSSKQQLKIQIDIAGRAYPLSIERDKEEVVRKAALFINKQLKVYQSKYHIKDIQDPLAMICVRLATELESFKDTVTINEKQLVQYVEDMNLFLDKAEED
ncbi:MAG: cell division protein ZapA [Flavobacteriales bacterium]|nr:cell division protein ZapA [Flavobacteriales bacterium]